MSPEDQEKVARLMVERGGFKPPEDEMQAMVGMCKSQAAAVAKLYAVAEARYASPAIVFRSDPQSEHWDWEY